MTEASIVRPTSYFNHDAWIHGKAPCSCWWYPVRLHSAHCCFSDPSIDYENDYCQHDGWELAPGDQEGTFTIKPVTP